MENSDSEEDSPKKKPTSKRARKDSDDFVPDGASSSDDAMEEDAVESEEMSTAEESPGKFIKPFNRCRREKIVRCRPKPAFYAGHFASRIMREVIYFLRLLPHTVGPTVLFHAILVLFYVLL